MNKMITKLKDELNEMASDQKEVKNPEHVLHLIKQYQRSKKRQATASSKSRGEISCSTAKAYNQKGTGRARRGSNRTPLRRGGGVIFGPHYRIINPKLNKKVFKKGLTVIINKFKDKMYVINSDSNIKKTKEIHHELSLISNGECRINMILSKNDDNIRRFVKNLSLKLSDIDSLDYESVLCSDLVIVSTKTIEKLNEKN